MHRDRPARRYAFAYALSVLLHCLLVLFFGVTLLVPGSVAGVSPSDSESLTVTTETARVAPAATLAPPAPVPSVAPRATLPPPLPVVVRDTPTPRPVPRPAQPHVARSAPRRHELSKQSPTAPPQQTRITALAPVVKASELPSPQPTAPPTAPPATSAPKPIPTLAATVSPTAPPTVAPTLPPTAPPTRPPTAPPTAVPTAAPTAAPTRAPTAAPTRAPTAVPTLAATVRPATPAPATPRPAPPATPKAEPPASPRPAPPASAAPKPAASPAAKPAATSAASAGPRSVPSAAAGKPGGATSPGPGPGAGAKSGSATPGPGAPGAGASPAPGGKGAVALRPAATPVPGNDLDKLNARLGNLLPGGTVSEYSHGGYTGKLEVESIPAEFLKKVSPPADFLRKTIALNYRKRTASQADSVLYVTGRKRILFEVCTGWMVELHPLGGGPPQGFPYLGPCPSDDLVPSWAGALPTPPPRPAAH